MLYNQIQSHLNLLCPHQSGFLAGYSTQDVLLQVTDKWLAKVNITGAMFLLLVLWYYGPVFLNHDYHLFSITQPFIKCII